LCRTRGATIVPEFADLDAVARRHAGQPEGQDVVAERPQAERVQGDPLNRRAVYH
jgi:hypothetical protein